MSDEVVVAEMPRASVTPGGELTEMELKNSDGSRQVTSAVGGRAVIVGMRLQNGLPVSFSIQPAEAEEFERQLGKAIKKARQESLKGRH